MNQQLKISKDEINQLPRYKFEGNIVLINTEKEAYQALEKLKHEKILGFDTETRASFRKGESYDVALLQLATSTDAYLFRLNKLPINKMEELFEILANPEIVKTGVAVRDDIKALQKLHPFKESNFVDLAEIAQQRKVLNFGLRALTAIFLKKRLSKSSKISNWSKDELTPAQITYAACDAVVAYLIYQQLFE